MVLLGKQSQKWIKRGGRVLMPNYARFPLVFTKGRGAILVSADNSAYLDFVSGIAVNSLGHCNKGMARAIQKQAASLLHISNLYYNIPQIELAEWLTDHSFANQVFFCNSGAEANEAAIKLARLFAKTINPNRFEIISAENSFHGRTLATLTATGQKKYQEGFEPLPKGFLHVPFDDVGALEKAITPNTAAVLLEPIQGEGGVRVPKSNYLTEVRKLCDKNNLLLVLDEVQTGMGRTGTLFAYEQAGITPDILTLAKGLGGGFPIGAMLARQKIAAVFTPGKHAATFGGNPLACSVALTVSKQMTPSFLKRVQDMGNHLFKNLVLLQSKTGLIKEVRGAGLLVGIDLSLPALEIIKKAHDKGLLLSRTSGHTVRMTPPLTVSCKEIDQAVSIFEEVLGVKA
ncbi:MAG: aspartate aminotransferase family protein [Nitrospirae bacterium]|nr:aspartate aminotransferase family protein [Candidatus Troglogloeales bacterium]